MKDPHRRPALISTGIGGLDHILDGGLPTNRLYLIDGDPGSGKTTLGLQFLLEGARRGESVLYVTLSETQEELRAVAASHGWSLDGVFIHELGTDDKQVGPEAQYTLFHPSEVELGETTKAVLEKMDQIKPTRVVFDSLSEMRLLAREPLRYRRQILALKQYFVGRQCTVLLLDDGTADSSDIQLRSLAHGVITLEHMAFEYSAERRRLRVLKLRGMAYRGGYHDVVLTTGGLMVYPRLVAADHHRGFQRGPIASGVPELDSLLGGGLDRGTSTLIIGPAGAGKSTLATQYAVAAAQRGERAAVFLFDENRDTFIVRATGVGMPLTRYLDSGLIKLEQIDPGEVCPGEFVARLAQAAQRDQARVVVIDSLTGYLNAMPEERFLVIQLHEVLTFLAQQGVVTLMAAAQHGMLGTSMHAPVDVSYLADTVILLRFFENAGRVRQALSVVKKRDGQHERSIREFQLTSGGIQVGAPLSEFHGILTGTPSYTGGKSPLFQEPGDGPAAL